MPQIGLITQNLNGKGLKERLIVILDIIESYERVYIWKKMEKYPLEQNATFLLCIKEGILL